MAYMWDSLDDVTMILVLVLTIFNEGAYLTFKYSIRSSIYYSSIV